MLIYNYGSSVVNPIDMISFEALVTPRGRETPSNKMAGPHFTHVTHSLLIFILGHIFCHCIPAIIADVALLITGKKTRLIFTINYLKLNRNNNNNYYPVTNQPFFYKIEQ